MPRGQLLIEGRWRGSAGGATMPVFDPTTEDKITDVASASAADTDEAIQADSKAFEQVGARCTTSSVPRFSCALPICSTIG